MSDNDIDFIDDLLTSFDRVKKRFVEVVRCSINKLNKIILSYSINHIICILLWNMHMIVFHLSRTEYRHGYCQIRKTYENLNIMNQKYQIV